MALWIDKYRPSTLDELDYNKKQASFLKQLVQSHDFPNLLIHGPSGSGKSTRIAAILRELYGPGSSVVKNEVHHIETPSEKKIEFHSIGSAYHLELTPSQVGKFNDRLVVQDVIKSVAQTQAIRKGSVKFKGIFPLLTFIVIVLNQVDQLSRSAQNALRRTMEKYSSACRLILCAETLCNIISPLRSRTLPLRVPCPSDDDVICGLIW
ncbi:replication factor C subunit 3-like [Octopus sinensis]|uniref:Replication factor C subunit 3-like n=1 Tax=Octopus sinensis TaxID=2607531 RepID=A0A7E6EGD0_9MOLL|nr:replication factor C subunit 3-like [Octopus sinensis]